MRSHVNNLLLVSATLLLQLAFVLAALRDLDNVPDPMASPAACGREHANRSAICDPDHQLTVLDKDTIEGYINKASFHAQIAVAVVKGINLKAFPDGDLSDATEAFARALHDQWGVGRAVQQDGVLLLLSIADRTVYLSVGQGVAAVLSPPTIQRLIGLMRPLLQEGKHGIALGNCVLQIHHLLATHSAQSVQFLSNFYTALAAFGFVVLLLLLITYKDHNQLDRLQRGHVLVDRFMRAVAVTADRDRDEQHPSEQITYFSATCPICLDDFPSGSSDCSKAAMALACGHVFCRTCLTDHLQQPAPTCPICRAAIDTSSPVPQGARQRFLELLMFLPWWMWAVRGAWVMFPADPHRGHMLRADALSDGLSLVENGYLRQAEIAFRLQRLHALYPELLPADQLQDMSSAARHGQLLHLVERLDAKQMELQGAANEMRRQWHVQACGGSSGNLSSFGGGISIGGGGGAW